jgi:site-specific DNA-adenine methylase
MQKKLAQLANELTERGVKVAISNSSEARGLYDPYFKGEPLQASRMLAANPASRADVTELLFTNFEHLNG